MTKAEQKTIRDVLDRIDEIVGDREGVSLDVGYLNDESYSLDQAEAEIKALIDQEVKKAIHELEIQAQEVSVCDEDDPYYGDIILAVPLHRFLAELEGEK